MDIAENLKLYWHDVITQNANSLKNHFLPNAYIRWNNTNEQFTVAEFIIANCTYPGEWSGEIQRMEIVQSTAITVTRVWLSDNSLSFHVTSFFEFEQGKIAVLNEYWGDDGNPPQWRLDKHIGKRIKST
ncbi:MAG: nuclear transport factor 2 family protein [Oscillospiraceae bacterium]|nr:nuclear transport factor 2 family protein [Oscillospiraceae bacterium]